MGTQYTKLPATIAITAGSAVVENYTLEGSAQPRDVVANVAGSVAGRFTGNAVSTPQVSAAISGATEYATYSSISSYFDGLAY